MTEIDRDISSEDQLVEQAGEPVRKEHWIREQRDNRSLGDPRGTRRGEARPCPLCAAGIVDHH